MRLHVPRLLKLSLELMEDARNHGLLNDTLSLLELIAASPHFQSMLVPVFQDLIDILIGWALDASADPYLQRIYGELDRCASYLSPTRSLTPPTFPSSLAPRCLSPLLLLLGGAHVAVCPKSARSPAVRHGGADGRPEVRQEPQAHGRDDAVRHASNPSPQGFGPHCSASAGALAPLSRVSDLPCSTWVPTASFRV